MKKILSICTVFVLLSLPPISGSDGGYEISYEYVILRVPSGESAYLTYNTSSGGVEVMPYPPITAGLSEKCIQALDMVPDWLKPDLAGQFGRLMESRLDAGDHSSPALGDLDADGDLDLVVGSDSHVLYFENTGNIYVAIWLSPADLGFSLPYASPHLADIDGDGDLDLFLGAQDGRVYFVENRGTPFNPDWSEPVPLQDSMGQDIDVGAHSDPALADMDGDGDLDLTVGSESGHLEYYKNENGEWVREPSMYEGVDITGYVTPALGDLDDDGECELVLGCQDGTLHYYQDIGTSGHNWIEDVTMFAEGERTVQVDSYSDPALGDLNGDLCLDLYVGDGDGLVTYFRNTGTADNPGWVDLSSGMVYEYDTQAMTGVVVPSSVIIPSRKVMVRTSDLADTYAEQILQAPQQCADEIGFSIAHTPVEVLRDPDVFPQVFRENAELIYEIDAYLDYVDLVERGGPNGSYTTTVYWVNESGRRVQYELPPEIYYWFIAHPKITDEIPTYINPDTGDPTPPEEGGRFWREYLFFHADPEYPPDPGGNVHYPKDEKPPLLKEKLADVTTLWNCTAYIAPPGYDDSGHNNGRPWDYGDHAVERVSNWVAKSLPLNAQEDNDGSRPIQPVRIYHEHNGNCGELQDLSTAAARTALIPTQGVCNIGEDHVWQEFYHLRWHAWDNWWSDGGTGVDHPEIYEDRWRKDVSCVWAHRGDDSIWNVNHRGYTDTGRVIFNILDREGEPVDGAIALASSHWYSERYTGVPFSPPPIPTFWNYSDESGRIVLDLGRNDYTINIWTPLGNLPDQQISVEEGNQYEYTLYVDGVKPTWSPRVTDAGTAAGSSRLELSFRVLSGLSDLPNLFEATRHDQEMPDQTVTFFICDRQNFDLFIRGYEFSAYNVMTGVRSGKVDFRAPDGVWYLVFSNTEVLKTDKQVLIRIPHRIPASPPVVSIDAPSSGSRFTPGEVIVIRGRAWDNAGIAKLEISNVSGWIDITNRLIDINWTYEWNTSGLKDGKYRITVRAQDTSGNTATASITIILGHAEREGKGALISPMLMSFAGLIILILAILIWKKLRT